MDEQDNNEKTWAQLAKDATLTGLATLLMTEENIRGYLKELKLPKDLVTLLLDNFHKKKEDLTTVVSRELGNLISKINIREEIEQILRKNEIELKAVIRFHEKGIKDEQRNPGDHEGT